MEEGEYASYSAELLYNAFVASNKLLQLLLEKEIEKILDGRLQFSFYHVEFVSYLNLVNSRNDISRTDFSSLYFSDLRLKSHLAELPESPSMGTT